jgi:hypothetical protein
MVSIALRDAGDEAELILEDSAPAFDPFARLPAAGDPRERPVGGQGLPLVASLSSRRAYERRGAGNRITVGLRKSRI